MTIAVAISGGIDSLVSAHQLKSRGTDVFGIHFITGYEAIRHRLRPNAGKNGDNYTDHPIHDIARQLDIPIHIVDLRAQFEDIVVNYFTKTYCSGRTPNPCVLCNKAIKFGFVYEAASQLGELIACHVIPRPAEGVIEAYLS